MTAATSGGHRQLPPSTGSVDLVLLDGGGFTTADDTRLHANGHSDPFFLYDWCFYLHHKELGRKILWDLGISDNEDDYTPFIRNYHFPSCNPVGPRRSLTDQLADIGVSAADIDTIIFSHAHWDHCRPAKSQFPNATIFFGPGTAAHCSPGHIVQDPQGQVVTMPMVQWDARFFGSAAADPKIQTDPFEELAGDWVPWGPVDRALDFLGDGSFWIVDAPGHMQGNLAGCVRLTLSGEWVVLASDCCHSIDLLHGRKEIAIIQQPDGSVFSLHEDIPAAKETIKKIRSAEVDYGMHVAMTHDPEWIRAGEDQVLMGLLHPQFDEMVVGRIRNGERP